MLFCFHVPLNLRDSNRSKGPTTFTNFTPFSVTGLVWRESSFPILSHRLGPGFCRKFWGWKMGGVLSIHLGPVKSHRKKLEKPHKLHSLKLTASLHLKMDGWKMKCFLVGFGLFSGVNSLLVSGRVCFFFPNHHSGYPFVSFRWCIMVWVVIFSYTDFWYGRYSNYLLYHRMYHWKPRVNSMMFQIPSTEVIKCFSGDQTWCKCVITLKDFPLTKVHVVWVFVL